MSHNLEIPTVPGLWWIFLSEPHLEVTGYSCMVLATSARTCSVAELFCSLGRMQRTGHISNSAGGNTNRVWFSPSSTQSRFLQQAVCLKGCFLPHDLSKLLIWGKSQLSWLGIANLGATATPPLQCSWIPVTQSLPRPPFPA